MITKRDIDFCETVLGCKFTKWQRLRLLLMFRDRCGKEITSRKGLTYKLNGSLSIGTTSDLCMDCWSELLKRIENVTIKERKDL